MNTFTFSDEAQILTVYNFSQDSQEYIGESDAYIAPNTGLPNYCTLISPPEKVPGFTPVWENETWRLIEDHRGQTVYNKVDGSQLIIQELGQLPENVTVISPTGSFERWDGEKWQPSITDAKEAKYSAIKNQRDAITTDYIIINNHHFHSDTNSRIQQLSLTKMGAEKKIPPGLMWKTKEGANKRGNSSRLTQSFHFFMFEPIFSPVNALNQPI
ncbi:tail fiber assembly protein [Escherichia coli]|uniref:tail fiber assembly protein n=1 Tax=Escherichia coli TaxID=562 RepID=UPI0025706E8F|nr:tail fiber assembly protein [Escherichia coli]MDL4429035.1 tail fiber assembly protein [Escherichia coli]